MKGDLLGSCVPLPQVNLTHENGTLQNKHLGNIPSLWFPKKLCQLEGYKQSGNHGLVDDGGFFCYNHKGHSLRSCV